MNPPIYRCSAQWMAAAVVALGLAVPDFCGAQQQGLSVVAIEPPVALQALERGEPGAASVITAAFRENYSRYTDPQRNALMEGVERIAQGQGRGDEDAVIRSTRTAFAILRTVALDPEITAPERNQVPARLLRIYHQTEQLLPRSLAVSTLGPILGHDPSDQQAIVALLVSIASSSPLPNQVPPLTAIDALLEGGSPGTAALRALHEGNKIQDEQSRAYLSELAKSRFDGLTPSQRR